MSTSSSEYEICVSNQESSEEFESACSSLSSQSHRHIMANVVISNLCDGTDQGSDSNLSYNIVDNDAALHVAVDFSSRGDSLNEIQLLSSEQIEPMVPTSFLERVSQNRYRVRYAMPDVDVENEEANTEQPTGYQRPRMNPIFPDICSTIFSAFCFLFVFGVFIYYFFIKKIA